MKILRFISVSLIIALLGGCAAYVGPSYPATYVQTRRVWVNPNTVVVQSRPVVVQPYYAPPPVSVYTVPEYQPYGVYPYYPLGYAWGFSYPWHGWHGGHYHHHH